MREVVDFAQSWVDYQIKAAHHPVRPCFLFRHLTHLEVLHESFHCHALLQRGPHD